MTFLFLLFCKKVKKSEKSKKKYFQQLLMYISWTWSMQLAIYWQGHQSFTDKSCLPNSIQAKFLQMCRSTDERIGKDRCTLTEGCQRHRQCSHDVLAPHADLLVRGSDPVLNGSARFGPTQILNWTFGPVQPQPRTPDGNPDRFGKVRVGTKVENQTATDNTRHLEHLDTHRSNTIRPTWNVAESHAHADQYDRSVLGPHA